MRPASLTADGPAWRGLLGLVLVSGALLGLGAAAALLYCDYRRASEFQVTRQLAALGERCITTLGEITPAAIVLARNQDRTPRPVPVAVRDSSRERRWTSP